jgi:hypothetical protein
MPKLARVLDENLLRIQFDKKVRNGIFNPVARVARRSRARRSRMSAIRVGDKWHAYSRASGKKVYVGSFDSKRAATEAADDHAARQRAIVRGELPPESNSKLSFDDAVEQWLDSLKARKARAHVSYKASTRSYLKPTFGTMLLAAISSAEIMDWRDELSTRFAPATVNGALIALSSAFTYFAKRGWVAKNPARGIEHIETPDRAYEWVRTREDITKLLLECPRGIRETRPSPCARACASTSCFTCTGAMSTSSAG